MNERAEALDSEGKVITGLFTAAKVAPGIRRANRFGGNALPDTAVFRRIAREFEAISPFFQPYLAHAESPASGPSPCLAGPSAPPRIANLQRNG